jgi:chemotaxis protein methyltransferase CheR
MRKLKLETYEDYLEHLRINKDSHESFINAITTNETYFYRTPRVWDYINDVFLPEWSQVNKRGILDIWSAASSTGEEAHTIGIMMQQHKEQHSGFDYKILATDIAPRVVEHASKGIYKGRSVERFRNAKPELFSRYMTGDDDMGFSVVPEIKSRLVFDVFNLFDKDNRQPRHDLVLLRNVLIYFTKDDQKRVMDNIHKRLKPEGIAIIGESETLNNLNTDFETVSPTVYRALNVSGVRSAA